VADSSSINVPLLDLKAQYATIREEIEEAIAPLLQSQHFVLGPAVQKFEEEVARFLGAKHAIGCASGGDALLLPLMAYEIGHGDQVICPTFTFFATAGTIARTGAVPVFADIDPATYNLDIDSLRETATRCKHLRAIMPVHLYGQCADMDAIQEIADERGVPVIEDAAQAIGALDGAGARIGSRGLVHGWSCYPTKNLGAFGDAGFVTTNDDALGEKIRRLRVHGGKDRYYHDMIGMNSRLDAIQAAVLSVKLRHLETWNTARRRHAARYDELFASAGATSSATPLSGGDAGLPLRFPHISWTREHHIYHQYVIRVPAELRDDLRKHLSSRNIGNEVFYPLPLHLQQCFEYLGGSAGDLPNAEAAAKEVIALPIYPELTASQIEHVAESIIAFVNDKAAVAR
jgi:dTDP-4-amino-4,6-dideoxygalactose transaminase